MWSVLLLAFVPTRLAFAAQAPGEATPIKRIVFLFSDEPTIPGNVRTDRGLRTGLAKDPSFRTEYHQEYLDLTRFSDQAYEERLAGVLSQKYGGRQPDLLITVASPALRFAARWGPIVFPGVPIVYTAATRTAVSALGPGFNAAGLVAEFDFRGTVEVALRLRPKTHRVVIVGGTTRMDQGYLELARADLPGLERQATVEYLVGLPMSELLDRVARLPNDAMILYVSIFRDGSGQDFQPPHALEMLAARSSVPVFSVAETFLGRGIVGGHLFDYESAAMRVAGLALRVLHGANPRDVLPPSEVLSSWMFDARQLKRWGIRESALPAGSQVLFKPPSIWREHPWAVLGAILFFLAETALIVGLVVERRQRLQAREQQRLLSAIVESSNDAVIGIDTERRIVTWNRGAQNIFGYTPEEAIGRRAEILVPPQRQQEASSAFEGTIAGHTVAPFETVRLRKDGSLVDVSISDSPIRDPRGKILGISSTQRDMSEARRAQQTLREREEHLSLATAAANLAPWVWYVKENSIWVTESAYRLYGVDPAVVDPGTKVNVDMVVAAAPPEEREAIRAGLRRALEERTPYRAEHRVVWPSGETRWILSHGRCEYEDDGTPKRMLGVSIDITERRRAEEAVRASEEKFRQFFKEVPDYCYIVSPQGVILDINSAALAALGYEREEIVGKPLATIYAPESQARMKELFAQWQQTGLIVDEEIVIVSKSGERSVVILNVGAERDQDGNIVRSTSVQTDITERKRAEADHQQLQQELSHVARVTMMGELSSSLAHELNQPLTAILSNAQTAQRMLTAGKPDLEELREILSDIVADDERAGGIIGRLRALLRKEQPELQPVDLNGLIMEVAGLVRSDTIIKNVPLTLDLAPDLPKVRGDRVQLQQVVLNLMLNAIDAMKGTAGSDRRLVARTENGEGVVRVAVQDSGTGIPADQLERIFEPFFTTKAEGMGMGLAIARSILRSHGGRLWAENNPTGGATFTLALPTVQ